MSWLDTWRAFIGAAPPVQDTQTRGNGLIVLAPRPAQSASALPRKLKRLMDAHAWTVGRLSKASGVNRSTIRNVLKAGKAHNHTLDVILRLAEALGVGIEELVGERER